MKKRFLYILLALCLTLSLCACGGGSSGPAETAPAETDAAQTASPEPTQSTGDGPATDSDITLDAEKNPPADVTVDGSTKFPLLVENGGRVFADLDGDGKNEEIRLLSRASGRDEWLFGSFTVNGHEYADEIYEMGFSGYDPDEYYYAITDIDKSDGHLEIAIQDVGPSSDYSTSFFDWDGTTVSYLGTVEGLIYYKQTDSGEIKFNGGGTISTTMRFKVLQTWWGDVTWRLENGVLRLDKQSVYRAVSENTIKTTMDVTLYTAQSLDSAKLTAPAGTALTVTACDNETWVKAADKDGAERWIYLENGYAVDSNGQQQYCWDAFDGLIMAD